MVELSPAEKHNLDWLYSVLVGKEYTIEFKEQALKNIAKFEEKSRR